MNNQYIYKDGKAYVTKNFKDVEIIDYYQGLEEVLKVENNIEFIENRIKDVERILLKQKENLGSKYNYLLPISILPLIPLVGFPIVGKIFGIDNVVDTPAFGNVSVMNLFGGIGGLFNFWVGLFSSIDSYVTYKYNKKEIIYNENQLEILKCNLEKYKEIIMKLQEEKINDKELDDFFIKNIDFDKMLLLNDLNINQVNELPKKRIRRKF